LNENYSLVIIVGLRERGEGEREREIGEGERET
jgi:hypothetical protein